MDDIFVWSVKSSIVVLLNTQANNPNLARKDRELWDITIKALLHLGAILMVDVFFHFLYILTIPADMKLVKQLSDWSLGACTHWTHQYQTSVLTRLIVKFSKEWPSIIFLLTIFLSAGLAYSNLVYDWVKAAVMFGVINTVSRLDHLDPPQPPKCITMLYVFAET